MRLSTQVLLQFDNALSVESDLECSINQSSEELSDVNHLHKSTTSSGRPRHIKQSVPFLKIF